MGGGWESIGKGSQLDTVGAPFASKPRSLQSTAFHPWDSSLLAMGLCGQHYK